MKARVSLDAAFQRMGRRDFLRVLGGLAGAVALGPRWHMWDTNGQPFAVPPTIMLHTKDRWKLEAILKWMNDNGYNSVTYGTLVEVLRGAAKLPPKPVIITMDDVGTDYIQPYFMDMIDLTEKAGYVGMLGVVTRALPRENPENWSKLHEIAQRGWQLDTHTTNHWLLPAIRDDQTLRAEIVDSAKMLEDGLDQKPTSLIVPYANLTSLETGQMDERIFTVSREAGLDFVVGMVLGRRIGAGNQPPYYLGRVGVGVDAVQTGYWLEHFGDDQGKER
ncbi:MAG: polysaccharide deacetylase family protein [Anaerolineae bacterium]|nr:polysaccharide deacetylase family protein [Anaerolineae bacterium]